MYNIHVTPMSSIVAIAAALLVGFVPTAAQAYFTPEEVLLSKEFFWPPHSRETDNRIEAQRDKSAERREEEQDLIFSLQRPVPEEDSAALAKLLEDDESLKAAAPVESDLSSLSEDDRNLLRAIRLIERRDERLLDRVYTNQNVIDYYGSRGLGELHAGAPLIDGKGFYPPPLQPTGAGGILAAITMLGAVVWTVRRVHRAGRAVVG
jgi:hypothetical protein